MGICTVPSVLGTSALYMWSQSQKHIGQFQNMTGSVSQPRTTLPVLLHHVMLWGWLGFSSVVPNLGKAIKKTWMAMECHSTIVRSPNPTSSLKSFLGQLLTGMIVKLACNRHILPSVLLLRWMMSISGVPFRKTLLRVLPKYINHNLFFYSWFHFKHPLVEREWQRNLLAKKKKCYPNQALQIISSLSMPGVFPKRWLPLPLNNQLNWDAPQNISLRLLILLHLPSSPLCQHASLWSNEIINFSLWLS